MNFEKQKEFVIYAGEVSRQLSTTACNDVQKAMAHSLGKSIADAIGSKDRSPHTLKNWITAVRNEFDDRYDGDIGLKKAFLDGCRLPEHLLAEVLGRAEERRQDRAHGQHVISSEQCEAILDGIDGWYMDSDTWNPVGASKVSFAYAIAMSGRRPIEVRAKNFDLSEELNFKEPVALFGGQAKMRGAAKEAYQIPLLCEGGVFREAVASLHNGFTAVEMRHIFDSMLESIPDWPEGLKLSAKSLRAFYACATYHKFAPEGRQKWHWINEVLGHEPDDMSTCQTYDIFRIG